MIERIPTRKLLVFLFTLTVVLYAIGALAGQSAPLRSAQAHSSESGFASLSPAGESGGAIVPASCESGYDHITGGACIAPVLTANPNPIPYSSDPATSVSFSIDSPVQYCRLWINTEDNVTNETWTRDQVSGGPYYHGAGRFFIHFFGTGEQNGSEGWDWPGESGVTHRWAVDCLFPNGTWSTRTGLDIVLQSQTNACAPNPEPTGYGELCLSSANICGQTQSNGTTQCDSSCSSTPPSDASCPTTCQDPVANNFGGALPCTYPTTCTAANICGVSNAGTIVDGVCNATAPANPAGFGSSCTSVANNCGDKNTGTIGCNGCSASAPADRNSCVPDPTTCTLTNACGATNTGILVNGVCNATAPANPAGFGSSCTSSNNCGDTNTGAVGCNGCSAPAPANRVCTQVVNGSCSVPAAHNSCQTGTSANPSENSSSWSWDCTGANGGTTASCTENKFNGVCSATHWGCSVGTSVNNTGTGPWSWTCKGFNGGSDASCTQSDGGPDPRYSCNSSNQCVATMNGEYSASNCNNACGDGGGGKCPDGVTAIPAPPAVCPGETPTKVNGACAMPATFFRLCTKGTVAGWNGSNPLIRTWNCVGSGAGATIANCSQDVTTLCVDRSVRLCALDGSYSFYRECGVEKDGTPCPYGCLSVSGYCQPPGSINVIQPLRVQPTLVRRDSPTRIYWNIGNASSCSVTGTNGDSWTNVFFSGITGLQSGNIQGHTVFTLRCTPLPPLAGGAPLAPVTQTQTVDIAPVFQEI